MSLKSFITCICICLGVLSASAIKIPVGDSLRSPDLYGTIRLKYAIRTNDGAGQFAVKNAIVGLSGKILPELSYKLEIDLDNNGKTNMRNAYAHISPAAIPFSATAGLMRVPFGIDVMRAPHQQYFANRSFVAKFGGNVRDVGLNARYQFSKTLPIALQAGIFQGNSLREKSQTWTNSYVFQGMVKAKLVDGLNIVASVMRTRPDASTVMLYDLGAGYTTRHWHFEAEGVYKHFTRNVGTVTDPLQNTYIVDAFAIRNFPIERKSSLKNIAALCRYDYISRSSEAKTVEDVMPTKHRITIGTNLRFGIGSVYAETRLSFEKYFFPGFTGVKPEEDRLTLELVCRF